MSEVTYRRCTNCYGYGKMMGGGMMQVPCDRCDGSGRMVVDDYLDDEDNECTQQRQFDHPKRRGRPKRTFLDEGNL